MREEYFRVGKCINVVDGDTIDVEIELGYTAKVSVRIRLADIQAPELNTMDGKDAKDYLEERILNKKIGILSTKFVTKEGQKRGSFGRWLGVIYRLHPNGETVTGPNVNECLINQGLAKEYTR